MKNLSTLLLTLLLIFAFSCVQADQNEKDKLASDYEESLELDEGLEDNEEQLQEQQVVQENSSEVIDGGWTEYSNCSESCGGGIQYRRCTNPAPANGGENCMGAPTKACNQHSCNNVVDGGWSEWSPCTKSCGSGVSYRSCSAPAPQNGGEWCQGSYVKMCNQQQCEATVGNDPVSGDPIGLPNNDAINGGWSSWSQCTHKCGGGTQRRSCNSPSPSNGGTYCLGSNSRSCNENACDLNTKFKDFDNGPLHEDPFFARMQIIRGNIAKAKWGREKCKTKRASKIKDCKAKIDERLKELYLRLQDATNFVHDELGMPRKDVIPAKYK